MSSVSPNDNVDRIGKLIVLQENLSVELKFSVFDLIVYILESCERLIVCFSVKFTKAFLTRTFGIIDKHSANIFYKFLQVFRRVSRHNLKKKMA